MTDWRPLRDYANSSAVLMGNWDFQYMPPVPAAANSLERMKRMLTGPLCGWPEDRLELIANEATVGDLPDRLVRIFAETTDVALFYYVGHGQVDSDDELCLCLGETTTEVHRRATTGLPYQAVRRALRNCRAVTKIVLMDCCFSGLAAHLDGMLAPLDEVADLASVPGTYIMTAAGKYVKAQYETGPGISEPQTCFTKYLVDLVEDGLPGKPAGLRMHDLFLQLRDNLARDHLPIPAERSVDAAREFIFARNNAPPDTIYDPQSHLQQLTQEVAEARARDQNRRADQVARLGDEVTAPPVTLPRQRGPRRSRPRTAQVSRSGKRSLAITLSLRPRALRARIRPRRVLAGFCACVALLLLSCADGSASSVFPVHVSATLSDVGFAGPDNGWPLDVTYSSDGRYLAGSFSDGTIVVWDAATHRPVAHFSDPRSNPMPDMLAISPDDTTVAIGDHGIYLWSITGSFLGHGTNPQLSQQGVGGLAFSPDDTTLAVGASGKSSSRLDVTYLWDLASMSWNKTRLAAPSTRCGLGGEAYSPSGRYLAVGDCRGSVYLFNTTTGKHRTLTSQCSMIATPDTVGDHQMVYSPGGKYLAAADCSAYATIFNAATGKRVWSLADPEGTGGVISAAFSPDGPLLAVADAGNSIYLWNLASQKIIGSLPDLASNTGPGDSASSVAISPDGSTLAVAIRFGEIYEWTLGGLGVASPHQP
jgi:WD40 repeat protein